MISHQKKFVFVHINCCAGTSLENALKQWGQWRPKDPSGELFRASQHSTILEYLKAYPEAKEFFTFAIVRNPWARMVTYYITHPAFHRHGFHKWVEVLGVQDGKKTLYDHVRMYSSCASWICIDGQPVVDYVGRFENLSQEFKTITDHLGLDASLPHLNKSSRSHYADYYDTASKEIIAKRFQNDIELFGYQFEET